MKIRPLTGQVLVRLLPHDEQTEGGLFLPDIAQESAHGDKARPRKALVLELGPWRPTKSGFAVLPEFQPGDTVLVSEYRGTKLNRTIGETLRICDTRDVLALFTNAEKAVT